MLPLAAATDIMVFMSCFCCCYLFVSLIFRMFKKVILIWIYGEYYLWYSFWQFQNYLLQNVHTNKFNHINKVTRSWPCNVTDKIHHSNVSLTLFHFSGFRSSLFILFTVLLLFSCLNFIIFDIPVLAIPCHNIAYIWHLNRMQCIGGYEWW